MANLGFVGLGVMGSEMVNRLLSKGHSVTGYNRTRAKAEWLIKKGMKWGETPKAVVAAADVMLSMVTNSAALGAVMNGPEGMLAALTPGKIFIDMSTVSPAYSREIATKVREKGGDMVDSPVSGSVITLQEGKLSVMVGGRKETFEKVKPLLLDIGPKVTYVGENGLALVMKIGTNLSLAVQMLAFCEGVLLAEKSGIARATAVDVLTHSVIASPMVQYRGPFVLKMPEEAWFNVNMMQKDMNLALELGRQVDVPLPTTAVTNEFLTTATEKTKKSSGETTEKWMRMYRRMVMIRLFEEQVNELYTRALMPGLAHLYIGEEAVAVGICEALRADDYITSTHRGHGHCVAKGASPDRMFAELLGKEAGYCRGKGGSMHIADPATGNLGANAIVGGSTGIATGAALSAKRLGTGQVAVCFFGEGALGQGVLYEVMNLAALWKLPVIYVCENNLYTEYTHYSETTAGDILARGTAFGVQAESVEGQDVRAVYEAAHRLVQRARKGEGPALLVCNTYRYTGHHVGDINREYYRSKQEEQEWKTKRDPIKNFGAWLVAEKHADEGKLGEIENEVRAEMKAAVEFAIAAPYPTVDQVDQDVYA
jgi:acetoin:2,6-dichlorophenolindophenol oxidoreductase subunit alpha